MRKPRPTTVSLPTIDGTPVVEATPAPAAPAAPVYATPAQWETLADPSGAIESLGCGTPASIVRAERVAEEHANVRVIKRALLVYAALHSGATYKACAALFNLNGTGGAVKHPAILGALLAPLGASATIEQAHIVRTAARTLCPNDETLRTFLASAPTDPTEYVAHIVASKATAEETRKGKRAARNAGGTGSKGEGNDPRTGETTPGEETTRTATPAEIIAEATRLVTLAAHEDDGTLVDSVRALTLACEAYADKFRQANPYAKRAPRKAAPLPVPAEAVSA